MIDWGKIKCWMNIHDFGIKKLSKRGTRGVKSVRYGPAGSADEYVNVLTEHRIYTQTCRRCEKEVVAFAGDVHLGIE